MIIFSHKLAIRVSLLASLLALAICPSTSHGQVPGDGIPDLYHFHTNGLSVNSSLGVVSRPAGTILVDTDGEDIVAILIEGPDLISGLPDNGDFLIGSTAHLPPDSDWTTGFINRRSQWVRTSPLDADGFVGVIGEYEDPFGFLYPNLGLAAFAGIPRFDDWGTVTIATNSGQVFEFGFCDTNFCVPEPSCLGLLIFTLLLGVKRRQNC